jgi:AcrR family transcriptional regulator
MNKRQISAQNTRQKLIEAALKIAKEREFSNISVEDITTLAHVAKGSFYTYFKRKEDIIQEICRKPFEAISEEIALYPDVPLAEKLTHYFKRFMEAIEIYDIHICRSWFADVIDPKNAKKDWDAEKWEYDVSRLKEIFIASIAKNELKKDTPVDLLVYIIISELYGMMTCWCMSDGRFEPLEWTEKFCNLQIKSLIQPYLK